MNILPGLDVSRWARLMSVTFAAQTGVQALAFAAGILVIRLLPPGDYALYTLANAALGTMTLLADSGVAAGVTALGGRVWRSPSQLAVVIQSGLRMRRAFAIVSLAVAVPWTVYLFRARGAAWASTIFYIAALLPAFYTALSGSLLGIPPKLQRQTWQLQKIQLGSNAVRLLLLVGALKAAPLGFVALACNAAGQIWQNMRLRLLQPDLLKPRAAEDPAVTSELRRIVRRLLPGNVYYAFFGQITLWIISLVGTTTSIAQVGALTRLTMVLTVISSAFGTVVIPRFATLAPDSRLLRARFLQIQLLLLLIGSLVTLLVWLFPDQALFILGRHYAQLYREVVLAAAGACVALIGSMVFAMNAARGKIPPGYLYPMAGIGTTALLAALINVTTVSGAMLFTLFLSVSSLIVGNLVFFLVSDPTTKRQAGGTLP